MTTELREDQLVHDTILYLPVDVIDPDPAQPRLAVDAELADSIAQHGVLQPIQVRPHPEAEGRWMLVDGERRWKGATAANLKTIPAQITLEVEDAADRLVRQIVRNEGKPLTPVEEAKAFKRIIDERRAGGDKTYGVVQLAKELGIAKSTISDRMALAQLPDFWMELIAKGPLQPSHAPLIAKWLPVPEKYHQKALEQMKADYRWTNRRDGKSDERLYVNVFESLLDQYMPTFIKPLSEVPGYEGPTMTAPVRGVWPARKAVHAADPSKWQSIFRKRIAAKREKSGGAGSAGGRSGRKEAPTPPWALTLVDAGATLKKEAFYDYQSPKGQRRIGGQSGKNRFEWWYGHEYRRDDQKFFDPSVLLRHQDPTKLLIYVHQQWDGADVSLVTKDMEPLGLARQAYANARLEAWNEALADTGRALLVAGEGAGRDALVMGGGAPFLIRVILEAKRELLPALISLAKAAEADGAREIEGAVDAAKYLTSLEREPAETLLNAIVCVNRDKVETPVDRIEAWHEAQLARYAKVKPVPTPADAPDPAAKKPTPRRRKNAVDEEALNAEATGEEEVTERDDADGPACEYCGCTTLEACELGDGTCSWISVDPPVCSNPECAAAFHCENDPVVAEPEDAEDPEPAHAGAED